MMNSESLKQARAEALAAALREYLPRSPRPMLGQGLGRADDAVRELIAPLLSDAELKAISRQHRKFKRDSAASVKEGGSE